MQDTFLDDSFDCNNVLYLGKNMKLIVLHFQEISLKGPFFGHKWQKICLRDLELE